MLLVKVYLNLAVNHGTNAASRELAPTVKVNIHISMNSKIYRLTLMQDNKYITIK